MDKKMGSRQWRLVAPKQCQSHRSRSVVRGIAIAKIYSRTLLSSSDPPANATAIGCIYERCHCHRCGSIMQDTAAYSSCDASVAIVGAPPAARTTTSRSIWPVEELIWVPRSSIWANKNWYNWKNDGRRHHRGRTRGDGKEGVTTVEKEAIRGRLEEEMGKGMNAWASAIFFFC